MTTPRLTFLYPQLFKRCTVRESDASRHSLRDSRLRSTRAEFSTSARRKEETYAQRYGPAAEAQLPPPSQPPVPNDLRRDQSLAGAIEKEIKSPEQKQEEKKTEQTTSKATPKPPSDREEAHSAKSTIGGEKAQTLSATPTRPTETPQTPTQGPSTKPLDTVLNRSEPPTSATPSEQKPPHLQASRYVHHFDTYTISRDLQKGGFTQAQSVTLMKAVRGLLSQNLDVAHDGLVSKSDMENETYLFRAACSELRTEIANLRRTTSRTSTSRLSHLEHETSLLSQRLAQEASALKDDLRGMLNDRRMAVRMEQQAMDQAIQELNYKITVRLMSGSKSEVEGLRWVLTRRAAMAIAGMAVLILGSLRWSAYTMHARELERKAAEEEKNRARAGDGGGGSGGGSFTVPARETSTQTETTDTEAMLANVSKDGSPAYVSLG